MTRLLGVAFAVVVALAARNAAAADAALIEAAKKEGQVVWYTTLVVNQIVRPLKDAFEKKYPGVTLQYTRADDLVTAAKILAEGQAGRMQADIFDSISGMFALQEAGLLAPFTVPNAADYPAELKAKDGYWIAVIMYVFTPGINTTLLPKDQAPKTFADLLDPKLKGKMAWNGSSMAGAFGFVANILTTMGEDKGMDYLRALAKQQVVNVDASSRAVLDQVIAGEYWINLMAFNHHTVISRAQGRAERLAQDRAGAGHARCRGPAQGRAASQRRAAAAGIFAVRGGTESVSAERLSAGAAERPRHGRGAAAERRRLPGEFLAAGGDSSAIAALAKSHAGIVPMSGIAVEVSSRGIATITLDRPERSNAFDQAMLNALAQQFAERAADAATRVVVLRGAGKHFCGGADLVARGMEPAPAAGQVSLVDALATLDRLPKPTIAVVHGAAVGGGAALAACCDIVLAADGAFFSIPEVRVGMAPLGVAPFLIRAMGHRSFRRYGLSGERFGAAEALRIGLVHEVVSADRLEAKLIEITDALLHAAPGAVREMKAAMEHDVTPSVAAILARRAAHGPPRSEEAIEGVAAFKEKRKPSWYPQ